MSFFYRFTGFLCAIVFIILQCNAVQASTKVPFNTGYIIEFEDTAPAISPDFYQQVINSTSQTLTDPQVRPRLEFHSTLFRGASFNITSNDGTTATPELIHTQIQSLPVVKKTWPLSMYYPQVPIITSTSSSSSSNDNAIYPDTNTTDAFSTHIQTGVDLLHEKNITGKGITIAVMDSGIDYLHPAFGGCFGEGCKVEYGFDFVGDDYGIDGVAEPDPDPFSECGIHGTHVAGIVGANPSLFGVVGVAPDATLNIYRVFGCTGGVANDLGINASLAIFEHGADVMTASLGGGDAWAEEPWAVVAGRINDEGTLFIFSAGNFGSNGPFSVGHPSTGNDVLAVGSAGNAKTPFFTWNGTYSVDDDDDDRDGTEFLWTPGYPVDFPEGLNIYPLSLEPDTFEGTACSPISTNLPDVNSTLVLAQRGLCGFDDKFENLGDAGVKYALFYNIDSTPSRGASYIDQSPLLGAGMIKYDLGVTWLSILKSGKKLKVKMATNTTAKVQVFSEANTVSGGRMSDFSSWGPTYEATVKPIVSGPGENILSTLPRRSGNYGVLSGTSMSAPFIAGVAALMKQINPSLTTTAKPMPYNDNSSTTYDFIAPIFQQGGGMVDAWSAVFPKAVLNVSNLAFNDTTFKPSQLAFSIRNPGDDVAMYNLSHIGAASLYSLKGDGDSFPVSNDFRDLPHGLVPEYAQLTITPSTVTIQPGKSETVTISVEPPNLDSSRLPIYSGYIALNSTDGTHSLTLPYAGIGTALKDIQVLDPLKNTDLLVSYNITDGNTTAIPEHTIFTLPKPNNSSSSSEETPTTGVFPAMQITPSFGSRYSQIDVLDAETDRNVSRLLDGTFLLGARSEVLWLWTGSDQMGGPFVEEGSYRLRIRALRVTGVVEDQGDWDELVTGRFGIRYLDGDGGVNGTVGG